MNSKLYNLMNWPEIEGITYGECNKPSSLLGGKLVKEGFLIQLFRPDAVEVSIAVEGVKKRYICEKVDEAGYYAVLIPGKKKLSYTVYAEDIKGNVTEYKDPYSFTPAIAESNIKKLMAGTATNCYEFLGAVKAELEGVSGTRFSVWAPNARRVSVVGDFNGWDGRVHQMDIDDKTGVFSIFIPGLIENVSYCYEIKLKNGEVVKKADPYYTGSNDLSCEFIWQNDGYKPDAGKDKPMAICQLSLEDLLDKNIVASVKNMNFNYVELSFLNSSVDNKEGVKAGLFCIDENIGADRLKAVIDEFHGENIGVYMSINMAYIKKGLGSYIFYDGTDLLNTGAMRLGDDSEYTCAAYNYDVPQVRAMLFSAAAYYAKEFRIDGLKLEEVAAMLYLDYGKEPGCWTPNMYGGNENLGAVSFIRELRKVVNKLNPAMKLIACEKSLWSMVTGDIKKEGLGFDYKLNDGWKKEFLEFYKADPLFRKGMYNKLSDPLLYQYSEDFIVDFGYTSEESPDTLFDYAPDYMTMYTEEEAYQIKQQHVKLAINFMYAYPGKKLISYANCKNMMAYMAKLNSIYLNTKALYQLDNSIKGFMWNDLDSEEETIVAFTRRDDSDNDILVIANFTPVNRSEYTVGVEIDGRYTSCFDESQIYETDRIEKNGLEYSITLPLPGLSVVMLSCKEYTKAEKDRLEGVRQIQSQLVAAKKELDILESRVSAANEALDQAYAAYTESKLVYERASEEKKELDKLLSDSAKAYEKLKAKVKEKKNGR